MRFLLSLLFLCILSLSVFAQTTTHVSFGRYEQVEAGVSVEKATVGAELSADLMRICKTPGGCGYQWDARAVGSKKIRGGLYLQGGAVYSSYRVVLFGKNSFQPLIGIKFIPESHLRLEANYRHDLNSENKQRIVEARLTAYLPKHIFFRTTFIVKRIRNFYNQPVVLADQLVAAGFYF